MENLTPMMEQYFNIKKSIPEDVLLLFRMGDFYEFFLEDAKKASFILGIALTKRHGIYMSGIPHYCLNQYINKLLRANQKIAVCDQVDKKENSNQKICNRKITRIFTSGTLINEENIENINENHYLLAINYIKNNKISAAWLDISTGDFKIAFEEYESLIPIFYSIEPKEIIVPEMEYKKWNNLNPKFFNSLKNLSNNLSLSEIPNSMLDQKNGFEIITNLLKVSNLEGFGIKNSHPCIGIAGAIINYVSNNLCYTPKNISTIKLYNPKSNLLMDTSTIKNLEIFKSSFQNNRIGSLINAIDYTQTTGGKRLIYNYLSEPLLNIEEILRRQNIVKDFFDNINLTKNLHFLIKNTRDLSRILSKIQNSFYSPRDLGGIKETINIIPTIKNILKSFKGIYLINIIKKIKTPEFLIDLLNKSLSETLPNDVKDGGFIKEGYDTTLDNLKKSLKIKEKNLIDYEESEKIKTGIKSLKIKNNKSLGLHIEIKQSHINLVPINYLKKQTISNIARFINDEIKTKEKELIYEQNNIFNREVKILENLISEINPYINDLREINLLISEIDIFCGWAILSKEYNYCKPIVNNNNIIDIKNGRHPVVEQMIDNNQYINSSTSISFIPNDLHLSSDKEQIKLITGPNMSGKSTFIRQTALITFMSQIGCWVPAETCTIGIVDRIFSRIGSSDELHKGNSTFMVEMNETANILNNATKHSLIVFDEVGRGTSTYDGISIAWSVIEYLLKNPKYGPKTLFATHYNELTFLKKYYSRISNLTSEVKINENKIIFTRKIIKGYAKNSYGIYIAELAGIPKEIIVRAKNVLKVIQK